MGPLPDGRRGQTLAVGVTLAAIGVFWLGVVAPLSGWYADREASLAGRRLLAARMGQVADTLPRLRAEAAAPAIGPEAAILIDAQSDAVAGAALQQTIQDLARPLGAALSSTEALAAEPAGGYRRIRLRVALNAPWAVLMQLLSAIRAGAPATPLMLVDDVQIHGPRQFLHEADPPLDASFIVIGFRADASPARSP